MKAAQQEIRSTVTVNTIDLGSKKKDDDSDLAISVPKKRGKEAPIQERGEVNCIENTCTAPLILCCIDQ